jgi:hypothetical protein
MPHTMFLVVFFLQDVYISIVACSRTISIMMTNRSRLHLSIHQSSIQLIREISPVNDLQFYLKCAKLLIDCQQQCIFEIDVNHQ